MIGEDKNGVLIKCPKCECSNLDTTDYDIDIDDGSVSINYSVYCWNCCESFEVIDKFKYTHSEISRGE